jgi:hypothetical protein
MAEHKVPQDVEADDKLLGPLSFRQFIYAMIALGAAALTYFIISANIIMPIKATAIAPILVFVMFGVLAIPRKGQPMETYIGALIHFYFQPTKRLWDPDGQDSLVEITNPPIDNTPQVKVGGAEAAQRLSILAEIEDSQGWSIRGNANPNLNEDFAMDASKVTDVFDNSSLNEELDARLVQTEQQVRDEAIARMNTTAPTTNQATSSGFAPPAYTAVAPPVSPTQAAGVTTPIVTPPPTQVTTIAVTPPLAYPAAAPVAEPDFDEASLSAMLKQSAASGSMNAFQQTVVQPLADQSELNNPTITMTASPIAPPSPPTQIATPTPAQSPIPAQTPELAMSPQPPLAPPPAPAPTPQPAPAAEPRPVPPPITPNPTPEPTPEPAKPATIDNGNDKTASISAEEVISHGTSANDSNQSGEISLH